jgi:hypothetical protein
MKKKYLVISHDAGGAEILSSWVRQHPENNYFFHLEGPAEAIFLRKVPESRDSRILNESGWPGVIDIVLTGTSWASDLEKKTIRFAKHTGIKVVSFLDHWANYPQRFKYNGDTVLPDEIWVGDEKACGIAKNHFPEEILQLVPNPYFKDITEALKPLTSSCHESAGLRILYVCEPIEEHSIREHGHPLHWGYTEYNALKYFLKNIENKLEPRNITLQKIRIRLHPSEKAGKYQNILDSFRRLPIEISDNTLLVEDCAWSNWVVGCDSMALVIGLLAGKDVFSTIPPGGKASTLPYHEIVDFKLF